MQVLNLSIGSYAYPGAWTTATIDVHVTTTTTASVTLTIVFAGSNVPGSPGKLLPDTRPCVLSGPTIYTLGDKIDVTPYDCSAGYIGVQVATTPAAQGGGPTYADLLLPPC